ncbi:hypothetical protein ACMDB5_12970 [Flavobacterium sp. W1B]|uniref:hypothetical protein n=1 Tax=Flavobacterium sp. W1B TaxID=3394146 RepID=UPI0039BC9C7A
MTNITNNTKGKDVQLHIEKAYNIIDEYLPFNYVEDVLKKLPKGTSITKGIIRNVKKKHTSRLDVLNAMVEVALDNKKQMARLKKLTT